MATYQAFATFFGFPLEPWLMGIAAVGALVPDIDHPKSQLGRMLPQVSMAVAKIFGHRGITHSFFALVGFMIFGFAYGEAWGGFVGALCIGYLSHLLADAMTHSGIPLLWPLKIKCRLPYIHFKTGGAVEYVLCSCLLVLMAWTWIY
jgi:inner membrane protein